MKKIVFKGSGVAIVTPMNEDGSVNYDTFEKLIEFQIKNKTDAIIVCGTTGESATLSEDEHTNLIKFAVEKVAGRIPVIAGTGSNNTETALKRSLKAQELGCDALLIVTPYYNKTSQAGLVEHYTYIANGVSLPIILYTVPSRTGVSIKPETCLELSKHKNIVAIKEASGNISDIAKIISLCGDNLNVYSGNDDQTLPIMSLGGLGVISVFANICPLESHNITKSFISGNLEKCRDMFLKALDLMNMLFCDVNPIPVKEALKIIGFNCGKCRLPLVSMNIDLIEKLKMSIKNYENIK
ncbi:MAG: 4-hydroxy-tetrahydrodipicolinate synthase [Eubacteriales bacterium SKADARSKE-1]|nr:4-hydroxy-tetrahydrodipicolinate synthase [Eubacteriales bacterium SKADARSKE-1]